MTEITETEAAYALPNWRVVDGGLEVDLTAKDFKEGFAFLTKLAELAEAQQHHPDFDVRYNRIHLRVVSHDVGAITDRDMKFATAADSLIDEAGLERN